MQIEESKSFPATIVMVIILFIGGWYLMGDTLQTYPAYVHAWTQTDRLALAQNFQENGFDFFHPATYSLLTKDGITQVDFPIHDYLVACISSLLDKNVVTVFRSYNLVYSLIGIFFFFRLCLMLTKSSTRAVFAASFLLSLPFYVYYQNGLLPSAPSFANFLIGLYFFVRALLKKKNSPYIWAVFFLTLAALARAPFLIFLVALWLFQITRLIKKRKVNWLELLLPLIGIVIFLIYYFYNKHLAAVYGSMFLAEMLSFNSLQHFISTMSVAADRWGNQLLSPFHGVLLVLLMAAVLWQFRKNFKLNPALKSLLLYFLISFIGVLLFFFSFGQQFADHDYYYIDSFLPLLAILLVIALCRLEIAPKWYTLTATLCGIFFFYFFSYAKEIQEERYTPSFNDRVEFAYSIYKESKADLKKWGVTKDDTVLVLEANSTNMPFTLWGYRGYTVLSSSQKVVQSAFDSNFTAAVMIDSFFVSAAYKSFPGIINELELINSNGKLSLYKKSSNNKPEPFFENLIFEGHSNFDEKDKLADSITAWTPEKQITVDYGKSLNIQPINEYTLSVKLSAIDLLPQKPINLIFVADYHPTDSVKLQVVLRMNDYYGVNYLENQITKLDQWQHQQYHYQVDPKYFKKENELTFYFWNPQKNELFVDNVNLIIYQ